MKHHTHSHSHHTHAVFHDDAMAVMLEAEGEFAAGLTSQAIARCDELVEPPAAPMRRIVDLGCGPGVAATQLAEAFDRAEVVGVDGSQAMLERANARVARRDLAERVQWVALNLNDELSSLGTFDLVWSALALHHTADERTALGNFVKLVAPNGLLCLLERADPLVAHPANELGHPGLWQRVEAAQRAWYERERSSLPGSSDSASYADMLRDAGLDLLEERVLTDTVYASETTALRSVLVRYIGAALRNLRDALDPDDVHALAAAAKRAADIDWGETSVTSSRSLFIARRSGVRA